MVNKDTFEYPADILTDVTLEFYRDSIEFHDFHYSLYAYIDKSTIHFLFFSC